MQALKIVLIGYGKMGHVIEEIARARGHEIVLTIDRDEEHLFDDPRFAAADVAIEFTAPAMAYDNLSPSYRPRGTRSLWYNGVGG